MFNAFGVVWVVLLFGPFLQVVDMLLPGDPWLDTEQARLVAIPTHIAAFHTIFNVLNTAVMLPLIGPLERVARGLVPASESDKDGRALQYISTPLMATPELAITAARSEVERMAAIVSRMLHDVRDGLTLDPKALPETIARIVEDENTTDFLELEINAFLAALTHGTLSTASNREAISLLSMINDLERMGDHCEKLARILGRKTATDAMFTTDGDAELQAMAAKAIEVVDAMKALISNAGADPIPAARRREEELDALRSEYRQAHVERLTRGDCTPSAGILFSDMLTSFEKLGDHAFNVVEATVGLK